ncbi:MAG TPA: hypothetical protein VIO57_04635, partial [Chloroflexota bacterium]
VLGPEMQSTGESMGVGATFGVAYWKAWLGAGLRSVPFGDTVYISAPQENTQAITCLMAGLRAVDCRIVLGPGTDSPASWAPVVAPEDLDVSTLGLVVVLGRSRGEIGVLRRAVDARVAGISTHGGLLALIRALNEGVPDLALMPSGYRRVPPFDTRESRPTIRK